MLLRFRVSALVALISLPPVWTGCSRSNNDYFPLTAGHWQYYQVDTSIRGEPHQQRLTIANLRTDGNSVIQQIGNLRRTVKPSADGIVTQKNPNSAINVLLPSKLVVGTQWSVASTLQLIESRTFSAEDKIVGKKFPVRLQAEITGLNDVIDTPAARFPHCLHVAFKGATTVRADRGHALVDVKVEHDEWYAPGVGLVRAIRTESSTSSFLITGTYTQSLLEFAR